MPDPAHPATVWSARLCVTCYLIFLAISVQRRRTLNAGSLALCFWSLAGVLLGVHTLIAFHIEHGWSHAAALQHTAERTESVIGIRTGVGLYVNYATLGLWLTDVAMQWSIRHASSFPKRWHVATQCVCAFIVFNATVVFGSRWWILVAVVWAGPLVWLWRRRPQARSDLSNCRKAEID
ncbi:hypothetical protein GC176_12740 [bacterium]|nr:hypothetical protein [bacterium]